MIMDVRYAPQPADADPAVIISPDGAVSLPDGVRGWAVYARLSTRKTGRVKKRRNDLETCERQIANIRAYAARRGMMISDVHIYVDNHLSAWKRDGKRAAFDKMITAAINGEVVGILVWKIDRFTRRTRDALWFIELAEKHDVLIDGPMSGAYDMRTLDGRRKLRDDASEAEHESDTIGARVRSRFDEAIPQGLMLGGSRIFGFELLSEARDYDDDVFPIQRPAEVAVIREVARRRLDGEKWQVLADDLNGRGLTTVKGNPWTGTNLALMMSKPYYGGYISRGGEIIGKLETSPDGQPNVPVLDAETYARLQALRAASKRGRRPGNVFKLTGAITCGRCGPGHTMAGGTRGTAELSDESLRRRYVCPRRRKGAGPGCGASISAVTVESLVREKVLERAADPQVRASIAEAGRALDVARADLRRQLGAVDAEIGRLGEEIAALELRRIKAGRPRDRAFEEMMTILDGLVAEQQARRYEYLAELGDAGAGAEGVPEITGAEWDAMTGEEQRDLIRRLNLTITVHPVFPGMSTKVFDPRRIVIK